MNYEKLPKSKKAHYIRRIEGKLPLKLIQTPPTPVSTAGVLALAEKTNRPLQQRNVRLEHHKEKSTRVLR